MPHLNRFQMMLGGLLIALFLAACNQAEPPVVDSPKSGEITVYTAMDPAQAASYLAVFRRRYPEIKVNLVRESTGIITQRLFDEADEPQADVMWGVAATSLLLVEWNDLLEPYAPVGLKRIGLRFRDPSSPPHWVGNDVFMSVFCVNTVALQKLGLPMPQSWQDLLKPVYKGHLVMSNPSTSGTGYLVVSDLLYFYGEQQGWDYLDGLDRNMAQYTTSGVAPCQLAADGDYAIGISSDSEGLTQKKAGNPIETVFPSEGSAWDIRASALVRKDQSKQAAQTFLNWTLSEEAMKLYAQNQKVTAAQPVATGASTGPSAQLLDKDIPWAAANHYQILKEWHNRYGAKAESSE